MQCRQCSTEIPADSPFCNRCGAAQDAERPAQPFEPRASAAQPAEETLWAGRFALRSEAHLWLFAGLWGALVFGLYLRFAVDSGQPLGWLALALALVPGLLQLGRSLVQRLSVRYRLTNHRLFTQRGLFARVHDEIELIRVDDVSVRQNFVQRLFGVGTVTLLSTDATNPKLDIEGVLKPLELKELIRTQVRARRARTTFLENL